MLEAIQQAYAYEGVQGLERIAEDHPPTPLWVADLVEGSTRLELEVPATWLVRTYLERGVELDASATAAWIRAGARLEANDARLHFCQSIARLEIPKRSAEPLARTLRQALASEHKFTRAWAVDALHRLAQQYEKYRAEALAALERALADPAPSVRARARQIAKERGLPGR